MFPSDRTITGLHHLTAITADAQRNIDFYTGFLGLRLVKVTVNEDDPSTYHLFYGNRSGDPGTLLTFFAWPESERGRQGAGQVIMTSLAISPRSLGFWIERCLQYGVRFIGPIRRFNESLLMFNDPDGLTLALTASPSANFREQWDGTVPPNHSIRGLHGVTICDDGSGETLSLLGNILGFTPILEEEQTHRFATGMGGSGTFIDVRVSPDLWSGEVGAGTAHHVALRTPTNAEQKHWRDALLATGFAASPIVDRRYFRSVYFREPAGLLLEISTDEPGFTLDEPLEELGEKLQLPEWLENRRLLIDASLPPLYLPSQRQNHS